MFAVEGQNGFIFDKMFGEGVEDSCVDFAGREVAVGARYQPGADPCMECVCAGGAREDGANMDA